MNPFIDGRKHRMGLDLLASGFPAAALAILYDRLFNNKESGRLLLETASLQDIDEEYNEGEVWQDIYEAVTVRRYAQTDQRLKALSRVFAKYLGDGITALEPQVGKPRKTGLFATVTAQIPFSDGQVVSIVFHSPDGDAKKIGPDDALIAFRWILNKKDITHVVSPENEADVSLEEVGKRIAQLVTRNSARFQASQKEIQDQKQQLDALKETVSKLQDENVALIDELNAKQAERAQIERDIASLHDFLSKQQEKNADLQNQLAAMQAQIEAARADAEAKRKLAEEEAAKAQMNAANRAELENLAREASDLGVSQDVIDGLIRAESIEGLKIQIDKAKRERAADEYNRMVEIGQREVPGIRLSHAEEAGRLFASYQAGSLSEAEWQKIKEDYYASGKAVQPEDETPTEQATSANEENPNDADTNAFDSQEQSSQPESNATPEAVTVAKDILSGKYDNLSLKEIMNLSAPIWDLEESEYGDLMTQADAYLTRLTRERAMAVV